LFSFFYVYHYCLTFFLAGSAPNTFDLNPTIGHGGAFYANNFQAGQAIGGVTGGTAIQPYDLEFDASRVVPVGQDIRPKNVYVNYIIKY